jgi:hypothetical protein
MKWLSFIRRNKLHVGTVVRYRRRTYQVISEAENLYVLWSSECQVERWNVPRRHLRSV